MVTSVGRWKFLRLPNRAAAGPDHEWIALTVS
jgi:hypothetical protein